MAADMIPEMITIREASKRSGLSYDAVRKLCISGQITHIRIGPKYFINARGLGEFLNTAGKAI